MIIYEYIYIYCWELLSVVNPRYDRCQTEGSLNGDRNSRRRGVGVAAPADQVSSRNYLNSSNVNTASIQTYKNGLGRRSCACFENQIVLFFRPAFRRSNIKLHFFSTVAVQVIEFTKNIQLILSS